MALSGALHSPLEAAVLSAQRDRLVAGAAGRVLEIGAATGLTLAHYGVGPAARSGGIGAVVACEPDAGRRRRSRRRAAVAPVRVTVVAARAAALPFADSSFDTVVCALALCMAPSPDRVATEMRRVLRPDGSLLFVEHVLGRSPLTAGLQRLAAPAWARVAGGCRVDGDAIATLRGAGFVVADCERPSPAGRLSAGTLVRGRAIPRRGT